jgi:hypothetical protein
MKTSLLRSLTFHVHFWSLQSSFCLVPLVPTRTTTSFSFLFKSFFER